jgi:hypothetical protein
MAPHFQDQGAGDKTLPTATVATIDRDVESEYGRAAAHRSSS